MKKAIVVGATSGIGKELARLLARNGYMVGVTGRRKALLVALKQEQPDSFFTKIFDVTDTTLSILELNELVAITFLRSNKSVSNQLLTGTSTKSRETQVAHYHHRPSARIYGYRHGQRRRSFLGSIGQEGCRANVQRSSKKEKGSLHHQTLGTRGLGSAKNTQLHL